MNSSTASARTWMIGFEIITGPYRYRCIFSKVKSAKNKSQGILSDMSGGKQHERSSQVYILKKLTREDCNIHTCPESEREHCFWWEISRHLTGVRDFVESIRKKNLITNFEQSIERIDFGNFASHTFKLFPHCPEWPTMPYLAIPQDERNRRINLFNEEMWREFPGDAPILFMEPTFHETSVESDKIPRPEFLEVFISIKISCREKAIKDGFRQWIMRHALKKRERKKASNSSDKPNPLTVDKLNESELDFYSIHPLRINPEYLNVRAEISLTTSGKKIADAFNGWLKIHGQDWRDSFPLPPIKGRVGASGKRGAALKKLVAWRLMQDSSDWMKAQKEYFNISNCDLYVNQARWITASKKTEELFKKLIRGNYF